MTAKKTILILCDWFLPGYLAGGPIQSIATLTKQLGKDIDFKIITTDRDFKADKAYADIVLNTWVKFDGRDVFYISPENMNPAFILNLIQNTPHDAIYLNSLFSKCLAVYPLKWKLEGKILSKVILAPRGMLGDGALAIKSFKKKLFLVYGKISGLFKNIIWQSTSSQETSEIKKRIGNNAKIFEVSNLPNIGDKINHIEKVKGKLRLCFISRISEKKNLNFAIDILKEVVKFDIIFDVYGPIEDELYWNSCKTKGQKLVENINFTYKGSLKPSEMALTIGNYHALFLPTQNENYGHIIVETLQHARPVILSDQTPWRNLQDYNAGFDIDLSDKTKFINAIEQLAQLDQHEFNKMSNNCLIYINKQLNMEEIKQKYIALFNS